MKVFNEPLTGNGYRDYDEKQICSGCARCKRINAPVHMTVSVYCNHYRGWVELQVECDYYGE